MPFCTSAENSANMKAENPAMTQGAKLRCTDTAVRPPECVIRGLSFHGIVCNVSPQNAIQMNLNALRECKRIERSRSRIDFI